MTRRTADGFSVYLFSTGEITAAMGFALPGVPLRRPKTEAALADALRAGRLFMGEVCIWNREDLGELYSACCAANDGLPGTVRQIIRDRRARDLPMRLHWRTLETDRNGRPTERVAFLPRLKWPGVVVFDFCGGPGSSRGRYAVATAMPGSKGETYSMTGARFERQSDLIQHLLSWGVR